MGEPIRVNVRTARADFADLLDRCKRGRERFVITRHGRPVARLEPFEKAKSAEDDDDVARYFPAGMSPD